MTSLQNSFIIVPTGFYAVITSFKVAMDIWKLFEAPQKIFQVSTLSSLRIRWGRFLDKTPDTVSGYAKFSLPPFKEASIQRHSHLSGCVCYFFSSLPAGRPLLTDKKYVLPHTGKQEPGMTKDTVTVHKSFLPRNITLYSFLAVCKTESACLLKSISNSNQQ